MIIPSTWKHKTSSKPTSRRSVSHMKRLILEIQKKAYETSTRHQKLRSVSSSGCCLLWSLPRSAQALWPPSGVQVASCRLLNHRRPKSEWHHSWHMFTLDVKQKSFCSGSKKSNSKISETHRICLRTVTSLQKNACQSTSSDAVLRFRHTPQWPPWPPWLWNGATVQRYTENRSIHVMLSTETQTSLGVGQLRLCFSMQSTQPPYCSQLSVSHALQMVMSFLIAKRLRSW